MLTEVLSTILPVCLVFGILYGARKWEQRRVPKNVTRMDDWIGENSSRGGEVSYLDRAPRSTGSTASHK